MIKVLKLCRSRLSYFPVRRDQANVTKFSKWYLMIFSIQIKLHLRRVIPTQKMKTLHKGICKEMILFTLSCDEVGKASISSKLCELLTDPSSFHEGVVR